MADKKTNQDPPRSSGADALSPPEEAASSAPVEIAPVEGAEASSPTLARFRLPRFFSQNAEAALAEEAEDAPDEAPVETPAKDSPGNGNNSNGRGGGSRSQSGRKGGEGEGSITLLDADYGQLVEQIGALTEQIRAVNERESAMERVFNTLHSELADYKNDFLYEHLKPVVRPLLFLFDSLEQFDGEVAMAQSALAEAGGVMDTTSVLSAPIVRENVHYFRDQLVEALRVCEVVLMDPPSGAFNSKFHKAVDVIPVSQAEDGKIMRVVRAGWFLNGQLLRPAEVVVGKFRAQT